MVCCNMCFNLLMPVKDCDGFVWQCHVQGKAVTSGMVYICIALIVMTVCCSLKCTVEWVCEPYAGLCVLHFGNLYVLA